MFSRTQYLNQTVKNLKLDITQENAFIILIKKRIHHHSTLVLLLFSIFGVKSLREQNLNKTIKNSEMTITRDSSMSCFKLSEEKFLMNQLAYFL